MPEEALFGPPRPFLRESGLLLAGRQGAWKGPFWPCPVSQGTFLCSQGAPFGPPRLGTRPSFQKGPPHASSNAVRWPKMAHRGGVPRMAPKTAICCVLLCSDLLRAFRQPGRSVLANLRPGRPLQGVGGIPGKSAVRPSFQKGPPHASSNAARWPKMAYREGVPRMGPKTAICCVLLCPDLLRAFRQPGRSVLANLRPGDLRPWQGKQR